MARNTERTALRRAWQKVQDKPDAPALRGIRAVVIGKVAVICSDGVKEKTVLVSEMGKHRTMTLSEWNSASQPPSPALFSLLRDIRTVDPDNEAWDEVEVVDTDRERQAFDEGGRKGLIVEAGQGFWKLSLTALQLFGLGVTVLIIAGAIDTLTY